MANFFRTLTVAGGLALALPLCAQTPEPATLGVQLRASVPEGGLHDAVGGGTAPGLGLSLVMEQDLVEHFEGWRGRVAFGMDFWLWGNLTQMPGTAGKVTATHLTGELVRMLRPGGDPATLVWDFVVGAGLYEWAWSRTDPTLGKIDTRTGHMAGTVGFGWRVNRSVDAELKTLMGKMDPNTTAVALMISATMRF